jgi:cytochrome c biogenesis protein CcmG/thiol:disulfide interchange protein DsbE
MRYLLIIASFLVSLISYSQSETKSYTYPTVDIYDLDNNKISTADISNNGKPILVITWAETWCTSCVTLLDEIAKDYNKWYNETGVKVVTINLDRSSNRTASQIQTFTSRKGWPFETYWDKDREFMDALELTSAPLILILNSKKKVFKSWLSNKITPKTMYNNLVNVDQNIQYFDYGWNYTSKENASFYRKITTDYNNFEAPYKITDYYMDGQLQMLANASAVFPDEIYEGEVKFYAKNGKLENIESYKKGILNGKYSNFYSSGQLRYEIIYKDALKWEAVSAYKETGEKLPTGTLKNGSGTLISYYLGGNKSSVESFKNGILHGEKISYFSSGNGKILSKYTYSNGVYDGPFVSYWSNGKVSSKGSYLNGDRHGRWKGYYDSGQMKYSILFDKDEHVEKIFYDPSGNTLEDYISFEFKSLDINEIVNNPGKHSGKTYGGVYAVTDKIIATIESAKEKFEEAQFYKGYKEDEVNIESMTGSNSKNLYLAYIRYLQLEVTAPIPSAHHSTLNKIRTEWKSVMTSDQFDIKKMEELLEQDYIGDFAEELEEGPSITFFLYFLFDLLNESNDEAIRIMMKDEDAGIYDVFQDIILDAEWTEDL